MGELVVAGLGDAVPSPGTIQAADFRTATVAEYCRNLELTTTEAPDAQLTAAIARLSERLDSWCGDHFEAEDAATLEIDGSGSPILYLPKRVRAVTTVKTRDEDGTLTAQASSLWRVHSSLNAAGTDFLFGASVAAYDYLEIIPYQYLTGISGTFRRSDGAVWPQGPQTVQVIGDFSWASTPADIKRAVALLVYDHFKPKAPELRRADRWTTDAGSFAASLSEPSGIIEVDDIIATYRRNEPPSVA